MATGKGIAAVILILKLLVGEAREQEPVYLVNKRSVSPCVDDGVYVGRVHSIEPDRNGNIAVDICSNFVEVYEDADGLYSVRRSRTDVFK
jgi:hypothetical protein